MALDCPVPDFPNVSPQIAEVREATAQRPPIVSLEEVQKSVEDAQAIERFRDNLRKICGNNTEKLENISISTYTIDGNLERINGVKLFIVSDKRTGKVLSYHEEDGRCVLELDKKFDTTRITLDNSVWAKFWIRWDVRSENGINVLYLVISKISWVSSAWKPWEYREGTPTFNSMMLFDIIGSL